MPERHPAREIQDHVADLARRVRKVEVRSGSSAADINLDYAAPTDIGTANATGSDSATVHADHVHNHPVIGSGDLHPEYTTTAEATTIADDEVAAHVASADPHPTYQRESEKGSASGYASLDGSGFVPDAQIAAEIARDSEVVLQSLADAKGDLVAASAADTWTRVAVGTDGQVLTADTASGAGVKWATPSGGSGGGGEPGRSWLGI